ncbi:MAG: hypothetical protein QOJ13_3507 [Gaiellales bacterium]|jgi:hypothetical protein|nr:hypothetical protein [Gaiellales bacterium]
MRRSLPWAWDDPQPLPAKVEPLRTFRGMFDRGEDFIYGIFDSDEQRVLRGSGLNMRLGEGAREIGHDLKPVRGRLSQHAERISARENLRRRRRSDGLDG